MSTHGVTSHETTSCQTTSRVAVIGSGISGLAAAYLLSRKHEVFLFEKDTRLGGHTHTVMVDSSQGPLPVDTGFIVHNDRTYPNFCRLMGELKVATQLSDMSFAVTSPGAKYEYSSRGAQGFFAQPGNAFSVDHWTLLIEILRFNREAPKLLDRAQQDLAGAESLTIEQFLREGRYDQRFIERYLYPMASAVWSMAQETLGGFPALTMIRFMQNHGMLGINTHPQWKTVKGGSHQYLKRMTAPFAERIVTGVNITSVTRCTEGGVRIAFTERPEMRFDQVVFACHGNQILPLLSNPSDTEREILQNFTTTRNEVVLHTDERMLPRRKNARASWNYLIGDHGKVTMTYDMNRLQALKVPEQYCVTLNPSEDRNESPAADKVIRKMIYYHPLFNRAAVQAQRRWAEISGRERVHYCGAYWFYGFHEDGVRSAVRVAQSMGVQAEGYQA
jgi:predicted NAD/FAD-binding protein